MKSSSLLLKVVTISTLAVLSIYGLNSNFQSNLANESKAKVNEVKKSSSKSEKKSSATNNTGSDTKSESSTKSHITTGWVDGDTVLLTAYDSGNNVEYEDISEGITMDTATELGYLVTVDMDKNGDGILDLDLRNGKWTYYNPEGFSQYYYIYGWDDAVNRLANQESTTSEQVAPSVEMNDQEVDEAIANDEITYQSWDDIQRTVDY